MCMHTLLFQIRCRASVLLLLWLLGAQFVPGQELRGSLLMTVQDASGGRVAGASITLTLEKSAVSRTTNADARGEARFDALSPGQYTVIIHASGFAEKTSRVVVAVSSERSLMV